MNIISPKLCVIAMRLQDVISPKLSAVANEI